MAGESNISIGDIAARAEKLEAEQPEKPAEKAAEGEPEAKAEPEASKPEAKTPAPVTKTEPEKKAPNDPEELRKWNTKVSMELSEVRKQLESLASTLAKTTKKQVDWKDLAKDPVKLQAAIEADRKDAVDEATKPYNEKVSTAYKDFTMSEKERRLHDPKYPRWAELMPTMVSMAAKGDTRVNFDQHPRLALDQMYDLACGDVPGSAAKVEPAAGTKSYSEAELASAKEEARKEAIAEAQKGLKEEAKGAGVGGMGKSATKGANDAGVKKAAWAAPMGDLKAALQDATDRLHNK